MDTAVDDDMLTDGVVVADHDVAVLSLPTEVLRCGRDDTAIIEMVVLADACAGKNAYVRADVTAVTNLDVAVNERECVDCNVLANLSLRMHECQWTDCTHD